MEEVPTYTPELVDGIAQLGQLFAVDELVLTDPAEEGSTLSRVSRRIFAKYGYPVLISHTTELERAVADASVVLLQLRIGGQAARAIGETLPLKCGCVGQETTGAGGLAQALRTVPVILEIAEQVSQLAAKDAWLIDFTQSSGHRHTPSLIMIIGQLGSATWRSAINGQLPTCSQSSPPK